MRFSPSGMSTIGILVVSIAVSVPMRAQNLPATPHTPDLLGIYPGMPMNAARAQLRQRSSKYQVVSHSVAENGFGLTIPDPTDQDQIDVYLTMAPNDPAVWMIRRTQTYGRGRPMAQSALLTALRQKYGKETLTADHGGGGLYLYWIFDLSGKLLSNADQGLTACSGNTFINNIVSGPGHGNTILDRCYASFYAVTAMLNPGNAELLQAYTVDLVNMPYAVKAATITMNANNAAAAKAKQNEMKKANQNNPTF
jgi:hypothetical protein